MGSLRKGRFTPSVSKFGYINRARLSTKRPFEALDIGTNVKIDPDGRIDLRDGYQQLFTTRPGWFEGTTLWANRLIENSIVSNDVLAYLSPHRKNLLEGTSGGVRYLFAGYVLETSGSIKVMMNRGTIATNGTVTWEPAVVVYSEDLNIAFKYLGDDTIADAQRWLEFSMAMTADKSRLFIAVADRDDSLAGVGNNTYGRVRVYEKDSPYQATWSAGGWTALELNIDGDTVITIDSDDALTHDIDIAVDSANRITFAYGYYDSVNARYSIHIREAHPTLADSYDTQPFILTAAGFNLFGVVLVYNTAKSRMMLFYYRDGAAADTICSVEWTNGATDPSADGTRNQLTTQSPVFTTTGGLFLNAPAVCIDDDGDIHLLYLKNATGGLYYLFWDYDLGTATRTDMSGGDPLSPTTTVVDVEEGDTAADITSGMASYLHAWDMMVRGGGSTVSVHIYYVEESAVATLRQIKLCEKFDTGSFAVRTLPVHVSQETAPWLMFLMADRTTQTRASRQLVFFDIFNTGTDEVDFRHLTDMLDAAQGDVSIEMMFDSKLTEVAGTSAQTKIIHCSDNRLRKRNSTSFFWEQLENTMDADNAAESWWKPMDKTLANGGFGDDMVTPDPVTHVNFKERKQVISVGYGVGTKLCGANYRLINRKIFDNSGTYDYADHFLDIDKIFPAPTSDVLVTGVAGSDFGSTGAAVSNIINLEQRGDEVPNPQVVWNGVAAWAGTNGGKFRLASLANRYLDEEFETGIYFKRNVGDSPLYVNEGDVNWRMRAFKVGLTFVYDGFQESQMYIVPAANIFSALVPYSGAFNGCVMMGIKWVSGDDPGDGAVFTHAFGAITVNLKLPKPVHKAVGGLNPRITAIKVYLGEVTAFGQTENDVNFYPAKTIIVSQSQSFKEAWWDGEKAWGLNAAGTYFEHNDGTPGNYWPVVIDVDDYLAMFGQGTYEQINGHSDTFFDTTHGLQRSPFPESWRCSEVFGNQVVVGGVRIDGIDRPNRLLINSQKVTADGQAIDTPDVYSDGLAIDLNFAIRSIAKMDDRTGVIIGDTGIGVLDVPGRSFRKLDKFYGTDAPDSVADIAEGKEGVGFLFKNKYRLFQGFVDPVIISEAITRDSEFGGITGIDSITDKTDCWAFYLGDAKQLVLIFRVSPYAATDIPVFIFDMREGHNGWMQAWFLDAFKCGCVGIDEKLYFTSGYKIFQYPYGQQDNGVKFSPDFRLSDAKIPEGVECDVERLFITANQTTAETLTATLIRDRNSSLNIANTITGTGSTLNTRREIQRNSAVNTNTNRRAKREVSLRIQATQPTTFKIEEIAIEGTLLERFS